jgi:hypothetical protein
VILRFKEHENGAEFGRAGKPEDFENSNEIFTLEFC